MKMEMDRRIGIGEEEEEEEVEEGARAVKLSRVYCLKGASSPITGEFAFNKILFGCFCGTFFSRVNSGWTSFS